MVSSSVKGSKRGISCETNDESVDLLMIDESAADARRSSVG